MADLIPGNCPAPGDKARVIEASLPADYSLGSLVNK
jgi:hypothetical protein